MNTGLSETTVQEVIAAIRRVVGPGPASLHEPSFIGNEHRYLKECIDSSFVSSVGRFVDRFSRTGRTRGPGMWLLSSTAQRPCMALDCRAWQRADAGAGADLRGYGGDAVTYCGILSIGVPLSDAGKLAIISPARPNSVTDVVSSGQRS